MKRDEPGRGQLLDALAASWLLTVGLCTLFVAWYPLTAKTDRAPGPLLDLDVTSVALLAAVLLAGIIRRLTASARQPPESPRPARARARRG